MSDTGVGIKDQNREKLFKQFEQFDKNELQSGGGSGLGLWISHFIVACHGGQLQFSSLGPSKGSSFFFDLPLYRSSDPTKRNNSLLRRGSKTGLIAAAASVALPRPHFSSNKVHPVEGEQSELLERAPSSSQDDRNLDDEKKDAEPLQRQLQEAGLAVAPPDAPVSSAARVSSQAPRRLAFLIVDDSPGNRKMLKMMLATEPALAGASVQEADDGSEAVKIVARAGTSPDAPTIDCVFMDSVMKDMHGPEAVRVLRSDLCFKGCIIGVTGNAMPEDVEAFQRSGLDMLLIKPLKKATLLNALVARGLLLQQRQQHGSSFDALLETRLLRCTT